MANFNPLYILLGQLIEFMIYFADYFDLNDLMHTRSKNSSQASLKKSTSSLRKPPRLTSMSQKKVMDYELYTKAIKWPRDVEDISFTLEEHGKPIPSYTAFIQLVYELKKKDDPLSIEDRKKLQKIFAYLIEHVVGASETEREKQRMFLCFNVLNLYPNLLSTKESSLENGAEEVQEQFSATPGAEDLGHIKQDMQFILNHLSQKNRAWIKICLIQELKRMQQLLELEALKKKGGAHDKFLDFTYVGSELANIGIVLQEVVGGVFLGQQWIDIGIEVSRFSNPIIYAFKVMQRGLKLAGRKFFGLEFAEDEVGINPRQTLWDAVSASIFLVVMVLLSINTPLLNTIAWLLAPIGLGIVWKSEYGYQNQRATDRLKNMKECSELFDKAAIAEASRIAGHKKIASYALLGVILGITVGMLAVQASSIPGLNLIFNEQTLGVISMISGVVLASLAAIRAGNFFWERNGPVIKEALIKFFKDPIGITKAFAKSVVNFLIEAVKSAPDKINAAWNYLKSLPEKVKNYWNAMDGWQKVGLGFTLASLALSIAVFSGGIPVLVGLISAGLCSLTSAIIKYAPKIKEAYIKRAGSREITEVVEPFTTEEQCNAAIREMSCQDQLGQDNNLDSTQTYCDQQSYTGGFVSKGLVLYSDEEEQSYFKSVGVR